MTAGIKEVGY